MGYKATLPAFVDEVPVYEVRDGRMHITLGPTELVMPIYIFEAGCLRGREAIAKWQLERLTKRSEVIPLSLSAGS